LSQPTLSQPTLSQSKLSHATESQLTLSQVSDPHRMPSRLRFFQRSGVPYSIAYSERANPSAGRSPRFAAARETSTGASGPRVPPLDRLVVAAAAAFTSSSPLPAAMGSGSVALPPNGCVEPTNAAFTWSGARSGLRWSNSAAAPDATAVAIEVPLKRK